MWRLPSAEQDIFVPNYPLRIVKPTQVEMVSTFGGGDLVTSRAKLAAEGRTMIVEQEHGRRR